MAKPKVKKAKKEKGAAVKVKSAPSGSLPAYLAGRPAGGHGASGGREKTEKKKK